MSKLHVTTGIWQATNWMDQFLTPSVERTIQGHSFWGLGLYIDVSLSIIHRKFRILLFVALWVGDRYWRLLLPQKVTSFSYVIFSFDSDRDTCNKSIPGINPSPPKSKVNRAAILAISVVVPVMALVVLVLAYLIWRQKRKRDSEYALLLLTCIKLLFITHYISFIYIAGICWNQFLQMFLTVNQNLRLLQQVENIMRTACKELRIADSPTRSLRR